MKAKIRKCFAIVMAAAVLSSVIPDMAFAEGLQGEPQNMDGTPVDSSRITEENAATVTNNAEFMAALEQHKNPINLQGLFTITNGADTDKRMLPVKIPAGTLIQGPAGSGLISRSPIQLEGDGVCFKDIKLQFESSTALNSVPHREIFLAGHSLTLDNVSTYLEGAPELGGFGGTEKELLPTVYAGGYDYAPGGGNVSAQNGEKASLTVINSNDETMFQAIHLGHGTEGNNMVPYQGDAALNLDAGAIVRENVDATLNTQAEINISGGANSYAKTKQIYGNENTTLTLRQSTMEDAVVYQVGNLVLQEGACLSTQTDILGNVTLESGACLDLNEAEQAVISGDFTGVESQMQERGILVLNENGTVTIEGKVSGTTQFQTTSRLFPGTILVGRSYIFASQETSSEQNFVLPQSYIERGYELKYQAGVWTVDGEVPEGISISRIEIVSAPEKIDLRKIPVTEDGSVPDEETYFEIKWYDGNGNVVREEDVENNMFYEIDYVILIKTDYWKSEEADILDKTDWYQSVYLMSSLENPGRYYPQAYEGAEPGDYTFLFCSKFYEENPVTVADVKALKDTVLAEQRVIFYDQDITDPEEPTEPTDPEEPKDPTDPEEPKDPTDPEEPKDPTDPTDPEEPKDPEEHEHMYQEMVTRPATCTQKGIKTYTCSCGETYTEEISALGHREVIDAAVAPTETTEGKTQGSHCSVCGVILVKQEVIPATGRPTDPEEHDHAYVGNVTKQPTCTEKGIRTYACSCGKTYTEEIPVLGHKYVEQKVAATVNRDGYVQQICSRCANIQNKKAIYRVKDILLNKTDFIYNGKVCTPAVTVKDSKGNSLSVGRDYEVAYATGRKNPGVYTVTVTLKGNYSGSVAKTFTIRPKGCSLGKLTAKPKGFQVAWKGQKSQTSGYQIQYCMAKNFKGKTAKFIDIKKNATAKKKVSKLKAGKKYYVRIRTYKTVKVNGKNTKLYSDWSKMKAVRTKK